METLSKVGLTLGKFAPLHKGHQFLIEEARKQVDRLYVLVYEANETWISVKRRAAWIRKLYPDVIVIEGHNAPQSYGYTPEIIAEQDAYIRGMMPERITHFFSSENYGEHVSAALGANDVRIDMNRSNVALSATIVRANPSKAAEYLHPIVLRDFIKRVVVLGAESTGKTTLTQALASRYKTTCMLEHGRMFWQRHNVGGKLSGAQLVELAREHRVLEAQAFNASNGLFFTDTNAFTTLQFCKLYGEPIFPALRRMAYEDMERYDLYLLCDIDIPFVQDGTRRDENVRLSFQAELHRELAGWGQPYHLVSGSVEERLNRVENIINA